MALAARRPTTKNRAHAARWEHIGRTSLRHARRPGQREDVETIDGQLLPLPAAAARHADLDVNRTGVVAQAEIGAQIVLRHEAPARSDLAHLLHAAMADRDPGADRESIPGRSGRPDSDPVAFRRLPV